MYRNMPGIRMQINVQSGFRQLKDRIIIAAMPTSIPPQEAFQYANVNKHYSWLNKLAVTVSAKNLEVNTGVSLTGLKGNDYADADQYDKLLFHAEANAAITRTFRKEYWLHANYRFVSRQPIYSYERELPSTDIIRVYNRAPAYHLLDINAGKSFFNEHLEISLGARNIFNLNEINFNPTDGQAHYRGNLRTQYIGYGRGFYIRIGYCL